MLSCRQIKLEDNINWDELIKQSATATFFQAKEWLLLWLKHWHKSGEVVIYATYDNDELIGIAPFHITTDKINLLGVPSPSESGSLSDFGDIIIKSGREKAVWATIVSSLSSRTIARDLVPRLLRNVKSASLDFSTPPTQSGSLEMTQGLELNFIRADSPSFQILQDLGRKTEEIDVAPYIELPKSWAEYLVSLDRHDRHELRRKMRKLEREDVHKVYFTGQSSHIEEFFRLMALSSDQKRNFLKPEIRSFFSDILTTFWPKKMLELYFLEHEGKNIAAVLYFIFRGEVLLYNSGFDTNYAHLAPGLVLNAYAIQKAIESGKRRFDFLRGNERYKYHLGGRERKLYKIYD